MSHWNHKGKMTALSVILLGSLTVGCNKSADPPTADANTTPAPAREGPKYPAAMSYWVTLDTEAAFSIKNQGEMGAYKQLEKITGTKVTFEHPPAGAQAAKDQFNLMMATGKLPDVMYYSWKANAPDKAIKDGKILRLNELIDKYAPNLSNMLKEKPDLKKQLTSAEGNIYVFPFLATDDVQYVSHGLFVRKDWLDKLKLPVPTTIDEWENMLIAFRDQDPNGNGKKDEIPYFYRETDYETDSPFLGAYGLLASFYQENGVVKFGPYEPKFKEYLTLMNRWYEAGLIDKDYLTSDTKLRDSKMLNDLIGAQGNWAASGFGAYLQSKKEQDPHSTFSLVGVPFPSLKKGELAVTSGSSKSQWGGAGAAITTSAKNPEEIAAWLDYGYGKEGHMLFNFGVEGESYTMVNGKPQYTDLIMKNPKKLTITQALGLYNTVTYQGPYQNNAEAEKQWHAGDAQQAAMMVWAKEADRSKYLPQNLNAEEQARIASIMADLRTYMFEMINKFIMGQEKLTKFDEYIQTLKKLKIEEAIKIYQTQYDRYLKS
ncbi:extracellular solute-binding protein [Paenibacillus flagellatus]|uniref:ABC transporter substrate-binding protein n=1 Tax=Paenibacillus flagellatus TaxID=2211139 RepID=A0A2V5KX69_9BACL|nr:extracellular solute-binding protein [Paenibacillus flagellatus]PYI56937.1 ABC transporter substrate-binding protein [Paenibacillus flagellatus]